MRNSGLNKQFQRPNLVPLRYNENRIKINRINATVNR
jgi:hypothetical protein